jgi:fatty-acyl-CoA synthase
MALLVGEILRRAAALTPRSLAASLEADQASFGAVDQRADQVASAFLGLGIGAGHRIASWTDISLRDLDVFFGAARAGAAYAPMNPSLSFAEAVAVVEYLRARALLVDDAHLDAGAEVARQVGVDLLVVGARRPSLPGVDFDDASSRSVTARAPGPAPDPGSPHVIFLTSGSTGRPKGVVLSHYATWMRSVPTGGATRLEASGGGGEVCMFPLFHMAGWNSLLCSWSLLRPVHLVRRADGDRLLGEVARWRAATLYCIPAVWQRAFEHTDRFDLSSLRHALTGTSLVTQELLHEIKDRLPGTQTTVSYGSTEMGVVSALGDHDLFRKPESIGLPNPGFEVSIIDGELCVRGETAMSGYFELPAETATAFEGAWYRSGDLAEMDDEGYLRIIGRRREIIRSGGETVAPSEIEAALAEHPAIREVAVVGIPDAAWGEVVCAVVVVEPGQPALSTADVRTHLDGRLARFKHPRRVECVTSIPRTAATGQIRRSAVRQAVLDGTVSRS